LGGKTAEIEVMDGFVVDLRIIYSKAKSSFVKSRQRRAIVKTTDSKDNYPDTRVAHDYSQIAIIQHRVYPYFVFHPLLMALMLALQRP
jgi:hypothetical protein